MDDVLKIFDDVMVNSGDDADTAYQISLETALCLLSCNPAATRRLLNTLCHDCETCKFLKQERDELKKRLSAMGSSDADNAHQNN